MVTSYSQVRPSCDGEVIALVSDDTLTKMWVSSNL